MMRRILCTALLAGLAATASAEPNRSMLTKENRLPLQGQFEVGSLGYYAGYKDDLGEEFTVLPYLRLGVFDNLALTASVPFHQIEDELGESTSGLGDASVGLEFRAYEDFFRYPYIIPYVDVFLPTGDEDDGLGRGENSALIGVSVGTVVHDKFHFILDAGYEFIRDQDNVPSVALSVIWDLDKKFSLLGEVEYRDEGTEDVFGEDASEPILFLGGFNYRASDLLSFSVFMGTESNSDRESIGGGKLALTF